MTKPVLNIIVSNMLDLIQTTINLITPYELKGKYRFRINLSIGNNDVCLIHCCYTIFPIRVHG